MLIILFLLNFLAIFEACIPTQQVTTTTTTTVSTGCPVCGNIYERNCVNSYGLACESAATVNAVPTLSGTTCSLQTTCTSTNAFYYLTADGSENYNHDTVEAHCDESNGIWYFGSAGFTPLVPISNYICLV